MTVAFSKIIEDGEELYGDGHGGLTRHPVPDKEFNPLTAFVDWIAFSIKTEDELQTILELKQVLRELIGLSPDDWEYQEIGWYGYQNRIKLDKYGLIAYGGKQQLNTVHIEINGTGCGLVQSWKRLHDFIQEGNHKITRIDLAHDDYDGQTANFRQCHAWYKQGLFNGRGRPPESGFIHDNNSGKGKTYYTGNRKNGKMFRGYEKGRQLGDVESNWFRIEVEYRSKKRYLPPDMILNPGQYLASSYKAFAYLSEEQSQVKTQSKVTQMTFERSLEYVHTAAGQHINAILQAYDGDYLATMERITRPGLPSRLELHSDHFPQCLNDEEIGHE